MIEGRFEEAEELLTEALETVRAPGNRYCEVLGLLALAPRH
jgi:hypothetical protein